MSCQPCGCDPEASYFCSVHRTFPSRPSERLTSDFSQPITQAEKEVFVKDLFTKALDRMDTMAKDSAVSSDLVISSETTTYAKGAPRPGLFPDSAQGRKDHPVFTGVLMYFPDAIAAVSSVSKRGNDQHNPGQSLRWAREKSTDQMDTATRHLMDHGVGTTKDTDGTYHLAKAAWRILAELQLTIEKERT